MKTILEQADYQLEKKNIRLATQLYLELIQTNPGSALAHQGLAKCFFASRKYDDAYYESQKALELDSALSTPNRILANLYVQRKQLGLYEHELSNIIKKDPNSIDAYIALGGLFLKTKRIKEGVLIFQNAVDSDPNNWLTHYYLSAAYLKLRFRKGVFNELAIAYRLNKSYVIGFAFVKRFYVAKLDMAIPFDASDIYTVVCPARPNFHYPSIHNRRVAVGECH